MKKFLLLALFSFNNLYSQGELRFDYDTAGNQVYRGVLTTNQSEEIAEVMEPLNGIVEEKVAEPDRLEEEGKIHITASPNPVTHQLQIIWENMKNQRFVKLALFSYHNQHLMEMNLTRSRESLELDFSRYPQGVYFLIFTTDKFRTQTYKIIKR